MSNRRYLERAIECFADSSKRSEYFDLYSEDAILHGYQGLKPGLQDIKRFYRDFWSVFPDARVMIQEIVEEGNVLVARYVITGTQDQPFMCIAPARQKIQLPGISLLHFHDGRCFERWTCSDSLILLTQLREGIPSST